MGQGVLTYLLLHAPINVRIIALLGCATLFLYNFSMILSKPENPMDSPYRRVRWIFSHHKSVVICTLLAFIAIIPLVSGLSWNTLALLGFTGILALSYNGPVLKIKKLRFGLRNIPGAKIFIIATVWVLSCVCVPITELRSSMIYISGTDIFLLTFQQFLFIIAITIPFDIRDLFQDQQYQLKTIPVLWGEKKALLFCQLLLFSYSIILFSTKALHPESIALTFVTVLTAWLIFRSNWERNERFYFFYLDGTLLLQCLAVWLVQMVG